MAFDGESAAESDGAVASFGELASSVGGEAELLLLDGAGAGAGAVALDLAREAAWLEAGASGRDLARVVGLDLGVEPAGLEVGVPCGGLAGVDAGEDGEPVEFELELLPEPWPPTFGGTIALLTCKTDILYG